MQKCAVHLIDLYRTKTNIHHSFNEYRRIKARATASKPTAEDTTTLQSTESSATINRTFNCCFLSGAGVLHIIFVGSVAFSPSVCA
jgi:hypothetical protein